MAASFPTATASISASDSAAYSIPSFSSSSFSTSSSVSSPFSRAPSFFSSSSASSFHSNSLASLSSLSHSNPFDFFLKATTPSVVSSPSVSSGYVLRRRRHTLYSSSVFEEYLSVLNELADHPSPLGHHAQHLSVFVNRLRERRSGGGQQDFDSERRRSNSLQAGIFVDVNYEEKEKEEEYHYQSSSSSSIEKDGGRDSRSSSSSSSFSEAILLPPDPPYGTPSSPYTEGGGKVHAVVGTFSVSSSAIVGSSSLSSYLLSSLSSSASPSLFSCSSSFVSSDSSGASTFVSVASCSSYSVSFSSSSSASSSSCRKSRGNLDPSSLKACGKRFPRHCSIFLDSDILFSIRGGKEYEDFRKPDRYNFKGARMRGRLKGLAEKRGRRSVGEFNMRQRSLSDPSSYLHTSTSSSSSSVHFIEKNEIKRETEEEENSKVKEEEKCESLNSIRRKGLGDEEEDDFKKSAASTPSSSAVCDSSSNASSSSVSLRCKSWAKFASTCSTSSAWSEGNNNELMKSSSSEENDEMMKKMKMKTSMYHRKYFTESDGDVDNIDDLPMMCHTQNDAALEEKENQNAENEVKHFLLDNSFECSRSANVSGELDEFRPVVTSRLQALEELGNEPLVTQRSTSVDIHEVVHLPNSFPPVSSFSFRRSILSEMSFITNEVERSLAASPQYISDRLSTLSSSSPTSSSSSSPSCSPLSSFASPPLCSKATTLFMPSFSPPLETQLPEPLIFDDTSSSSCLNDVSSPTYFDVSTDADVRHDFSSSSLTLSDVSTSVSSLPSSPSHVSSYPCSATPSSPPLPSSSVPAVVSSPPPPPPPPSPSSLSCSPPNGHFPRVHPLAPHPPPRPLHTFFTCNSGMNVTGGESRHVVAVSGATSSVSSAASATTDVSRNHLKSGCSVSSLSSIGSPPSYPVHVSPQPSCLLGDKFLISGIEDSSWTSPPPKLSCSLQQRLAVFTKTKETRSSASSNVASGGGNSSGIMYKATSECLEFYPNRILRLMKGPMPSSSYDQLHRFLMVGTIPKTLTTSSVVDSAVSRDSERAGGLARSCSSLILPPPATRGLRLWMGAYYIPRDDKRHRGGEDAWFCSASLNAMGVADGVSEWEDLANINPQIYAQGLMKGVMKEFHANLQKKNPSSSSSSSPSCVPTSPSSCKNSVPISPRSKCGGESINDGAEVERETSVNPQPASVLARHALTTSYEETLSYGSSTAIVALMDARGEKLGVANLGDSSGMVLRRTDKHTGQLSVVRRVKEMQHEFNVPYQFAHLPTPDEWERLRSDGFDRLVKIAENVWKHEKMTGVSAVGDSPSSIESYDISVREGDLIILATDGLFDNIFDYEITALTGVAVSPREAKLLCQNRLLAAAPRDIAKGLALAAYWKSLDCHAHTPFSRASRRRSEHSLFGIQGGKEDDITVVVAWVVSGEDYDDDMVEEGGGWEKEGEDEEEEDDDEDEADEEECTSRKMFFSSNNPP